MRNMKRVRTGNRLSALAVGVLAGRALLVPALTFGPALVARAQEGGPRISYPQEGTPVRGTVKVLFEGVPEGGYAMVYIDLTPQNRDRAFRGAVTDNTYELDTFPLAEGRHSITIVGFNEAGRRLGQSVVNFEVANSSIDPSSEAVRLVNWTLKDRVEGQVQRYRIYAESNANITGGGGGSGGGSSSEGGEIIPAPLDWQVDMLVRRIVRDVAMVNGSANIKLNVKEAYQRQREDSSGGGGSSKKTSSRKKKKGPPSKAPWAPWEPSSEVGQGFVKMITAAGVETNATRKPFTIALGDILPLFPEESVRPGSPWQTEITIVSELARREPITVSIPMRFTSFETFQTPSGAARRCARLETGRASLPDATAMKIARVLQAEAGKGQSGGSGSGGAKGAAASDSEEEPIPITIARSSVSRVLWFDIAAHRVLRSEDVIDTYYEEEVEEAEGAASPSTTGEPAAEAVAVEPVTVTYNLRVIKYLDDNIPPVSDEFNAGAGTAHSRDSVKDPSLTRVTGKP